MRKKRQKVVRGIQGNRSPQEVVYRKSLLSIVAQMESVVIQELIPVVQARSSEFKADGILTDLSNILRNSRQRIGDLEGLGTSIATRLASGINVMQSGRFRKIIQRSMGIDIGSTITPRVSQRLEASVVKNVSLIKSIPEEYFSKIEKLIHENVIEGRTGGDLITDIRNLNKSTKNRANLIARDQTATLVSQLNMERQKQAGIIGYQWRNSRDKRVRGNPKGLYPKSKFNHWGREGLYFLWEKTKNPPLAPNGKPFKQPPADGSPGIPVQCRCTADPVI